MKTSCGHDTTNKKCEYCWREYAKVWMKDNSIGGIFVCLSCIDKVREKCLV
jgi:hypothetical protein